MIKIGYVITMGSEYSVHHSEHNSKLDTFMQSLENDGDSYISHQTIYIEKGRSLRTEITYRTDTTRKVFIEKKKIA